MIQVKDKIISMDVFEKQFVCDLSACKGACCVEGDSGAPLLEGEKKILEKISQKVKPYMTKEGILEIEKNGITVYDEEGDLTTPLINNRQCVFVVEDNGVSKCGIEKAYLDKEIDFRKPISCHLFPIRIKEYTDFEAVNYEEIKICNPACKCGSKLQVPCLSFFERTSYS